MSAQACLNLVNNEIAGTLLSFRGVAQLSSTYEFKLELLSSSDLNPERFVSSILSCEWGGVEKTRWSGLVQSYRSFEQNDALQHYSITLVPQLSLLKNDKKKRVFRNKSLIEVINSIALSSNIPKPKLSQLTKGFLIQDHWLQFNESDYEFVSRLLYENKISFYFDQEANWILVDNFNENGISLAKEFLKDKLLKSTLQGRELYFNCSKSLSPGELINVDNEDFIVQRVKYHIHENKVMTHSQDSHLFHCEVEALTKVFNQNRKAFAVAGYQRAHLVSDASEARTGFEINALFDWDSSNYFSYAMPISQHWSGQGQGLQFIPEKESLVCLNFLEADPNRAFVASGLCPGDKDRNSDLSLIKTKEHLLKWQNLEDKQNFELRSAKDMSKEISGQLNEDIQRNEHTQIKNDLHFELKEGKNLLSATKIIFKIGSSTLIMDSDGIHLNASKIELQTAQGVNKALARFNDFHQCPQVNPDASAHTGGPISEGSDNVYINGLKVARFRDEALCNGPTDVIAEAVSDILINGQPCAYQGAKTLHGGFIQAGSVNVSSVSLANSSKNLFENASKASLESWVRIIEFI